MKRINQRLLKVSIEKSCFLFEFLPEYFLIKLMRILDSFKPNLGNLCPYECDITIGFLNCVT
jgi:hypothetical protein